MWRHVALAGAPEGARANIYRYYTAEETLYGETEDVSYHMPDGMSFQATVDWYRYVMPIGADLDRFSWCRESASPGPDPSATFQWSDGSDMMSVFIHEKFVQVAFDQSGPCSG